MIVNGKKSFLFIDFSKYRLITNLGILFLLSLRHVNLQSNYHCQHTNTHMSFLQLSQQCSTVAEKVVYSDTHVMLTLYFNSFFPGEPGLAGVYWSKGWWNWWQQLELQVVQSSSQKNTTNKPTPGFLQAGCPSCYPTNSVKALKGKYPTPWTCLPQTHLGVFQLCLWPLLVTLGEVCHVSHQPSDASTNVNIQGEQLMQWHHVEWSEATWCRFEISVGLTLTSWLFCMQNIATTTKFLRFPRSELLDLNGRTGGIWL